MKGLPQATNFEKSLADIYVSEVQNIILEAKYRQPENLVNIAKRRGIGGLEDIERDTGANLARLKQHVSSHLRYSGGEDKISSRLKKNRK